MTISWRRALVAGWLAAMPLAIGQGDGKIAPKPLYRDPVHDGAADPVLVWNRGEKKWFLFYTNRRANVPGLSGVEWVHGTKIGYAESGDGGATWKYDGTVETGYGRADYSDWAPEIVDWRGTYHMYLAVVPGTFRDWNAPRDIIHLTSGDLRHWKFESKLELGSDRVIDPSVIRLADGGWRMWFKNERGKNGSICYADSKDLNEWKPKGLAVPGLPGEGPKIFWWKGRYWMIVDAWDGLAVLSSEDTLHWARQGENLLKTPGTEPTDRGVGHHCDVVVSGGRAFLFYFVHQGGENAVGKGPLWGRHTFLQVVELGERHGVLTCDRNKPTRINLLPGS